MRQKRIERQAYAECEQHQCHAIRMAEFVDKPSGYEEKWQFTAKALDGRYGTLQCFHSLLKHTAICMENSSFNQ